MPQKKKVLFVITKASWGGAQRYVRDLASSLPGDIFESVVAYGQPGQLSAELERRGVRTVRIPSLVRNIQPLTDMGGFFEIFHCIREERPDIVHLNSSKAGALGALAAWLNETPRIVFTVHGWPFKERRSFFLRLIMRIMSWLTAVFSDVVIVVSRIDAEIGKKMPFVGHKIQYCPIGIDMPAYLSRSAALTELWNMVPPQRIPLDMTRVLTIAELTPNKAVDVGIKAIIELSRESSQRFLYVIMGDGEQRKYLEELVRVHHIEDQVVFMGFVPDAYRFLLAFDAFLLPSVKEGMPYVLLEAGETGLPVVATEVVNPELKERFANLRIVRVDNSFSIADALRTVGPSAIEQVDPQKPTHFTLQEMVGRTVVYYRIAT